VRPAVRLRPVSGRPARPGRAGADTDEGHLRNPPASESIARLPPDGAWSPTRVCLQLETSRWASRLPRPAPEGKPSGPMSATLASTHHALSEDPAITLSERAIGPIGRILERNCLQWETLEPGARYSRHSAAAHNSSLTGISKGSWDSDQEILKLGFGLYRRKPNADHYKLARQCSATRLTILKVEPATPPAPGRRCIGRSTRSPGGLRVFRTGAVEQAWLGCWPS